MTSVVDVLIIAYPPVFWGFLCVKCIHVSKENWRKPVLDVSTRIMLIQEKWNTGMNYAPGNMLPSMGLNLIASKLMFLFNNPKWSLNWSLWTVTLTPFLWLKLATVVLRVNTHDSLLATKCSQKAQWSQKQTGGCNFWVLLLVQMILICNYHRYLIPLPYHPKH